MTENMQNTLAELARLTVANAGLKIEVSKLEALIAKAYHELKVEEQDPDDCRFNVIAMLRPVATDDGGGEHG